MDEIKHGDVEIFIHQLQHLRDRPFRKPVITVHKQQELSFGHLQAGIPGMTKATVRRIDHTEECRIAFGIFCQDLPRVVGRSVIYCYDFILCKPGNNQRIKTFCEIVMGIVNRDDDAELQSRSPFPLTAVLSTIIVW